MSKKKNLLAPEQSPKEQVRQKMRKALDPLNDIAEKLLCGRLLSEMEFEAAVVLEYFDRGRSGDYAGYVRQNYEDDERYGMLCPHAHRTVKTRKPDGSMQTGSFCIFGIHACCVKRSALKPEQVDLLKSWGWTDEQIGSGDHEQQKAAVAE